VLRILLASAGLLALAGAGAGVGFYLAFVRDLPRLRSLEDYSPPLASHVFDRNGRPIAAFYRERRRLVRLDEVPDHVVRAFVAGEDSSFFQHSGIDYMSILRAAWVNLLAGGEIKQGGSTITQQMVKTLLLSPERSYRRKVREMILARDIEQRFTKDEILFLYLNQIYFGHGAHGIGEAARSYFDKDVSQLSISEGALLAGLPKAPSRYSPYASPEQAERRRQYVLERMHLDGFLDEATYGAALAEVPVLADPGEKPDFATAAYFGEEVRRLLFEALGADAVLEGGLVIETTLDLELQRAAVAAVRQGLLDLSRRQGWGGPQRRVARAEIAREIELLGLENGLVAEDPLGPGPGPFAGVVTAVDAEAQTARVALAPGLAGEVALADVAWARKLDPEQAPQEVRSIEKVFHTGDVASFAPLPAAEDGALRLSLYQEPSVEGALLSLELASGEVLALVGGYDFARSQFDRVTQARRQPGSSFKPVIYGAALARGYTPASIVFDRPVVYTDEASGFVWRPQNYGRAFYGPITLRDALARSVNNATVHLFRDVGVDFVIAYARRLGIESPLSRDLSLALGSSEVTLLELTRAYAVFGHQGRRVRPLFIRRVLDRHGEVLLERVPLRDSVAGAAPAGEPEAPAAGGGGEDVAAGGAPPLPDADAVLPPEQAYLVTDLLRAVVNDPDGTGWRLRALARPVAGKTGTTNEQADAWFIGFSPEIATGVWVGHDETRFLGWGETGSRAAAPIWVDYMRAALAPRPVREFPVPEQIVFARIDRKTGLLADAGSPDTVFQAFLADTVPTETSDSEKTESEGRRLLRLDDAF
jgi:penicillin-binding protein 1A